MLLFLNHCSLWWLFSMTLLTARQAFNGLSGEEVSRHSIAALYWLGGHSESAAEHFSWDKCWVIVS